MTSVFGNVFRLSGGESVWANVFVLEEPGPTDGWRAGQFNRVSVAPATNRTAVASELSRVVWAHPQGK